MLATLGFSILGFVLQWIVGVRGLRLTLWIIGTVIVSYLIVALSSLLWNVARIPAIRHEELSREVEGLRERLKPRLDITFDETKPGSVDRYLGRHDNAQKDNFTLYRVAVTSPSPCQAKLRVESVTLKNGRTYSNLHLRSTHRHDPPEQEIQLHSDVPEFWDVIQKADSIRDWVDLTHIEKVGGILLPSETQFRIVASCDEGFGITKLVTLNLKENGDLDFKLTYV